MPKSSRKKNTKAQTPALENTASNSSAPIQAEMAGIGVRLMALVYDSLLLFALYALVCAVLVPLGTPSAAVSNNEITVLPEWYRSFVLLPACYLMTILFYGYFWKKIGQTLGMQTWRLKVQRYDRSTLTWKDSFTRCVTATLFPVVCGLTAQIINGTPKVVLLSAIAGFLFNYAWIFINRYGLAWHDQRSGTVVARLPKEPKEKRKRFGWFEEKDE